MDLIKYLCIVVEKLFYENIIDKLYNKLKFKSKCSIVEIYMSYIKLYL